MQPNPSPLVKTPNDVLGEPESSQPQNYAQTENLAASLSSSVLKELLEDTASKNIWTHKLQLHFFHQVRELLVEWAPPLYVNLSFAGLKEHAKDI